MVRGASHIEYVRELLIRTEHVVDVALVAKTMIEWPTLLQLAKSCLGRSISTGLDAKSQAVNNLRAYIAVLGELEAEGSDPDVILREVGSLLRHIHVSFLVATASELKQDLASETELKVNGEARCFVVSGNLEQWRTAVINGCVLRSKFHVRVFFDKCLMLLEREGLAPIWLKYGKVNKPDHTFVLEAKK